MIKTIEELIEISGDSYLEDYSYNEGVAVLKICLEELEQTVNLKIRTNLLAFDIPERKDIPYRTFFLELVRLSDVLTLKNGIYIASDNFGKFMKEKRDNLNLAYGLKSKDYEFIFSLSGSNKLVSFIIEKPENIEIEFT